jgi:hypothetical protein
MSWRRLRVVIQGLPPESRTMTALRAAMTEQEQAAAEAIEPDPEAERWSLLEHLVAMLIDVQRQSLHAFFLANSDGGSKGEAPKPIPRPGLAPKKRKKLSTADIEFLINMVGDADGG